MFDKKPILPLQLTKPENEHWIGIAPFARYKNKTYPASQMQEVIALLNQTEDVRVFLFGGRGEEKATLELWTKELANVRCIAGSLQLHEELALMAWLDVMVSMDSANMHLASLAGVRVVSIWGGTAPACGFLGWQQQEGDALLTHCDCQPCTIAGTDECAKGDYHCMTTLTPSQVVDKLMNVIRTNDKK